MTKPKTLIPSRENAAIVLTFAFVAGFLGARAILSIATLLLGLNALRGTSPRDWLRHKGWLLGVLWVAIYAVSFFWSENKGEWGERVQVKLPLLLLPLAMAYPLSFSRKQTGVLMSGVCLLLLSGIAFSLSFFVRDAAEIAERYGSSFTFRTPAYNCHICFSAFLAASVFWIIAQWPRLPRAARWLTGISAFIFVVYLHILAAKTGLVMLYGVGAFFLIRALYRRRFARVGLIVGGMAALLIVAWLALPTFRARVGYVRWSMMEYNSGRLSAHYSDPGRLYSYKVAWAQIQKSPFAGYGAGDLMAAMDAGYERLFPEIAPENRLVPHNQFLASGVAVGIPATLALLLWWLAIPAAALHRPQRFYNVSIWALVSILLFIDPAFEVQYGMAVFLFFLYWFRNLHSPTALSSSLRK